jgi:predicted DNA-binding transcriptional regulator AlpA
VAHQPPERIVLERNLHQYDGYKETRRNELIALGRYPKPIKFGERRKVWLERDIVEYQHALIAGREYTVAQEARNNSANDPRMSQPRWKPPSK